MDSIQKKPFFSYSGLIIRELNDIINQLPDFNEYGDPFGVWVETLNDLSSPIKSV